MSARTSSARHALRPSLLILVLAVLGAGLVPGCKCSPDAEPEAKSPAENALKQDGDSEVSGGMEPVDDESESAEAVPPQDKEPAPIVPPAEAPPASPRLDGASAERAAKLVESFPTKVEQTPDRALHMQVDKPMYEPGDTIYVRLWNLDASTLSATRTDAGEGAERKWDAQFLLETPSGRVLYEEAVSNDLSDDGAFHGFPLSKTAKGGIHKLTAILPDGQTVKRDVFVNATVVPRFQMKLEFERKAYGMGDTAKATFEIKDNEGQPVRNVKVDGTARFDSQEIKTSGVTDGNGSVTLSIEIPQGLQKEDAVLTARFVEGGAAESTTRRIPLVLNKLDMQLRPEGGELIAGLPSRVYFEARRLSGKPADVKGKVINSQGNEVANFRSIRDGFGRFAFTPKPGESYELVYSEPEGVMPTPLMPTKDDGCNLKTYDDFDSQEAAIRVGIHCTHDREVQVLASLWRNALDAAAVSVKPGQESVVYLKSDDPKLNELQGLAQVTLLDAESGDPLAERMVYRNRRQRLDVEVTPDKAQYAPRDQVKLTVTTTNPDGEPVPAHLTLSAVDDALVSLADDKEPNLMAGLMLGNTDGIEDPNWFFDLSNKEAAAGLDAVVGTRTWRRFELADVSDKAKSKEEQEQAKPSVDKSKVTKKLERAEPDAPRPAKPPAEGFLAADEEMAGLLGVKQDAAGMDAIAAWDDMDGDIAGGEAGNFGLGMQGAGRGGGGLAEGEAIGNIGGRGSGRGFGRGGARLAEKSVAKPKLKPGRPDVTGSLDKRIIRKVVNQHKRELKFCYQKELRKNPGLAGKIEVKWTIDPTGNVAAATVSGNDMGNANVANCLNRSIRRWRFPAPKGGGLVVVKYPFVFESGGGVGSIQPRRQWVRTVTPRNWSGPDYSADTGDGPRTDFRKTVYWNPGVVTDESGVAELSFYLSDATTSFRIFAEGVSQGDHGVVGRSETTFPSVRPFAMAAKLPAEVSTGDRVDVQVVLQNKSLEELTAGLTANTDEVINLVGDAPGNIVIPAGSSKTLQVSFEVSGELNTGGVGDSLLALSATARGSGEGTYEDAVSRNIRVAARGFPKNAAVGGRTGDEAQTLDLSEALPGTISAKLTIEPGPTATMMAAMEDMLRRPSGCFEQTSSANYPNLLVVDFMKKNDVLKPAVQQRAMGYLKDGYKRLVDYESPSGGFEWFGKDPGHLTLTAYGILEFTDMKRVYSGVDQSMIDRTVKWMLERRDGNGGFKQPPRHLHTWSVSPTYISAYSVLAMVSAGHAEKLTPEVDFQAKAIATEQDPYLLAMRILTLQQVPRHAGKAADAAKRLAGMQAEDGSWPNAASTITASGGQDKTVETTALAARALEQVGGFDKQVRSGIDYIVGVRATTGRFGSTQATVQALQTLAGHGTVAKAEGTIDVQLVMDGKEIASKNVDPQALSPAALTDVDKRLEAGKKYQFAMNAAPADPNQKSGESLPWQMNVDYRVQSPPSAENPPVSLKVTGPDGEVKSGESVRMTATIENTRDDAVPMVLVSLAFPGGFTTQKWQIEELNERDDIAFVETRARQVYVYLYGMEKGQTLEIPLELKAEVPGQYTAEPSSAELYYTTGTQHWVEPLQATIVP